MFLIVRSSFVLILLFVTSACVPYAFRDDPMRASEVDSISIITDSAFFSGTDKKKWAVEIFANKEMAKEITLHVDQILRSKGYLPKEMILSSVGAWMGDKKQYGVVRRNSETGELKTDKERSFPPYFINDIFRDDDKVKDLLDLHFNLATADKADAPEALRLGFKGDALMVIDIGGLKVPRGRQVMQAVTYLITAGKRKSHGGGAEIKIFLIDLTDGMILWEGVGSYNGNPTKRILKRVADKVMRGFPTKK